MPTERERKRSKEAEIPGCEGMSSTNTRILELRKEKSRDAARSRRGKENYEFYELAKLLPLPGAITSQLDKASIIRLSISYLKLRDFSGHGDPPWHRDGPPPNKSIKGGPPRRRNMTAVAMEIFETHQGTHILQSLDGFGFALANDGRFLYISETVSIYLGLSQVEMTGSSVFDYVHVKDHSELAEHLGLAVPQGMSSGVPSPGSLSDSEGGTPRSVSPSLPDKACIMNPNPNSPDHSFCIRMKSTLTKRGVHVKTSGYRVVHIIGHHRPQFSFSLSRKQSPPLLGMVALAIALPPPTVTELRMESDTFVMRLSPEFKVLYCEPRIGELMDLSAEDVTNTVLYDHCHAADLQKLRKSHVDLLQKGQVMTEYYRLMNKHGGYVWVQTCATTICTAKNLEEQNVVSLNYVLSGVEFQGCVMNSGQLKSMPNQETDHSDHSDTGSDQENDRRKEKKEESVPRERTQVGENEVTPFGSTSKSALHVPGTKTTRCNSHKEFSSDLNRCSPQTPSMVENDSVFLDRPECIKPDAKNSRRKMDRPRKRKREVESDSDMNGVDLYEEESHNSAMLLSSGSHTLHNGDPGTSPDLSSSPQTLLGVSPVPEDLSVKPASSSPPCLPSAMPVSTTITDINNSNSSDTEWSKTPSGLKEEGITSSSVKDLEEAMNKHLPVLPEGSGDSRPPVPDLSTDISETSCLHAKQKSTIQWIGSQQPTPDPLAASNLLRSLYANRESVIRTNICNTRPHYYGDHVAVNMLTPPGNDSYKEPSQMSLHPLQYPGGKTHSNHHSSMSSYTNTPITVSMTTHVTDTSYNMTPPSSVSPQDKFVSPFSEGGYADGPSPHCPTTDEQCQRIPVKPQLYSMPMPAHLPAYADRSSHLSYPSISTYNSTGASFPSYTSSSANLGAESNSSWYPQHFATP